MRPHDLQSELLWEMSTLISDSDLDAEELGRVVLTLDGFVRSGLVTQTEAGEMLGPVREGWS
jgi:hypothetical protein